MLLDIYQCFIFPDKYPHVDQIKTQVANPDFMAVLAPQWPEPDPDPTEDQAFLQQLSDLSQVTNMEQVHHLQMAC